MRTIIQNSLTGCFVLIFLTTACSPEQVSESPTQPLTLPSETPLPPTPTDTPNIPTTTTPEVFVPVIPTTDEFYVLSLADNGYQHLFIYSPQAVPLHRITNGTWDDITPSISHDGKKIAFSSRRNGYFDIYTMELQSGSISRITDSLAYDSSPAWSPDSQWLVYDTYENGNYDIRISSAVDPSQAPISLTSDSYTDHSPAWSPLGRQIAFTSNRSGDNEIWIVDLDQAASGQYANVSNRPLSDEGNPTWSSDGSRLAWASRGGIEPPGIYSIDVNNPGGLSIYLGPGDQPEWSPTKDFIAARLSTPNDSYITAYNSSGQLAQPPVLMPGTVKGFSLGNLDIPSQLPGSLLQAAIEPTPIWSPSLESSTENLPPGRIGLVDIPDVQAPFPQLNDLTNESFTALRNRLINETGWDVLANLENAFIPLTSPSDPSLGMDWIYTGRAFSLNPVLMNAGWLVAVREEFGNETYWQVYLRPTAQDGSQGAPLVDLPWDLNARYNLDPVAYDEGGRLMESLPSGYWVDLTDLALRYGWERLPALTNWRTYFKGIRFNEFALTGGLDWGRAMLEVYPPEVLITPTAVIPPTFTPTRTPWGQKAPTITLTSTPRPTFTPAP